MLNSRARLVLRVVGGKRAGTELTVLPGAPLRIGRASDCHVRPQSEQISRQHCEIFFSLAGFMVKDCGSRCGTFLDERRINEPTLLGDGQTLRVGPFSFYTVMSRQAATASPAADETVNDADICAWLDESGGKDAPAPKPDESAIFRKVLRIDERSCEAAEQALLNLKKRKAAH